MVLEVVLVAAVLGLVGLAVYQANQHAKTAATQSQTTTPQTAVGLAASAAVIAEEASAADTALAADAESATSELADADADMNNLGSTANESF